MIETGVRQHPSASPLRGELRHAEPMARHVSWRAGGPVAHAYFPADLDDLWRDLVAVQAAEEADVAPFERRDVA